MPYPVRNPLLPLLLAVSLELVLGCSVTEPTEPSPPVTAPPISAAVAFTGFRWGTATPESQGMCGTTLQLGCTTSLLDIWTDISNPRHNTKRFLIIRNDKIIYDRGGVLQYHAFSSSKGLLGAPTLVHAMSKCGVHLTDPASEWLGHGDGDRWNTDYPWTDITVEQLATHTSGICDYSNTSTVCRNESKTWQRAFEIAKKGGPNFVYPGDAFTIARTKAEQNSEPALAPGSTFEYSNVGHALLNYVVQRACGQKLTDIFNLYIKQAGMGPPYGVALITTDGGQQFNQATGTAKWKGPDGAAVLRLASRQGIWDNRNVEPVRYWHALTKVEDNIEAAAERGRGVVYSNNSMDLWTQTDGHKRLSPETFGHNGNYSTIFLMDPLSSTIIVRQGDNNANGASYLTKNGCAPGWTGTAPTCTAGTNWSNNWNVNVAAPDASDVGSRNKVVDPLQEAFFFPPPFCRMISVAGTPLDSDTDVYDNPADATTVDLVAEITVNPREGAGSSEIDRVEFYKETTNALPQYIGNGELVPGTSPEQYQLSYDAVSHGSVGAVQTYFANCIAKSTQDGTKKVPSYSAPVRVKRN